MIKNAKKNAFSEALVGKELKWFIFGVVILLYHLMVVFSEKEQSGKWCRICWEVPPPVWFHPGTLPCRISWGTHVNPN